ncbi:DUF2125 domain-containing protein [Inquilinus sp. CAU 1745]|uniref:DUF2125 domain-containing protein n=1 Tax=Inquilinus sp. CAU 1745 TaxID=3140369 RepID=UPI00325B25C5
MRRFSRFALFGLVIIAVAYVGYWFYAASLVRSGIEDWIMAERQRGATVQAGDISITGFPFTINASSRDIAITRPDGLMWEANGLTASALPWSWEKIDFTLTGGQRLVAPGQPMITGTAQGGEGEAWISPEGRIIGFNVALDEVVVSAPQTAGTITLAGVDIGFHEVPSGEGEGQPDLVMSLDAREAVLPQTPLSTLGNRVESAGLGIRITAPVPQAARAPMLEVWRDSGGEVLVDRLSLDWGPLSLDGEGRLTLDEELQPEGVLNARVAGFVELIDGLAAEGILEDRAASFAKAGLTLLAGPAGEDGTVRLAAPIVIENGHASLGPVPLGPVPRIDWRR